MVNNKIYIAGPMTGIVDLNFPAFDAAEQLLRKAGWHPVSPAAIDRVMGHDPDNMDATIWRDVVAIMQVDAIFLLNGWERSKGANAERSLAMWRGIHVLQENIGVPEFDEWQRIIRRKGKCFGEED